MAAADARRRPVLVLAVVAVVAVVLAGYFAWLTIFRPAARADAATTVVNTVGGYSLQVPKGLTATRKGKTTRLLDASRSLSVTITTTGLGRPKASNDAVVTAMRSTYAAVAVLATKRRTVDHRPGLATYGVVQTKAGQKVQFVLLSIRGTKRNFSLSAFAPVGESTSAGSTQERFDRVVDGFRIGTSARPAG